ncbi:universal stress protein [Candidatus Kaiserbacteria bacterium]|nr:universal stress protein [Candidatus Kaiserbacteria bacterium]
MKILLAIDGSEHSDAAVSEVSRRPWPQGTEVRIITVDTPWKEELSRGRSSSMFDELNRQSRADAWQRLNEAVAVIKRNAPGLVVSPVLREGHPKDKILDEAESWGADLIVVGSHGYGAIKRLFLGSVSLAIATRAACSVEIVRVPPSSVAETVTEN